MNKKERKFSIGDQVRNRRTNETAIITAYDLSPEVYSVCKKEGFSLWGELEIEKIEDAKGGIYAGRKI